MIRLAAAFALTGVLAHAAEDPEYDIKAHCIEIAEVAAGSKQIELHCRRAEERDRADWLEREVDPSIVRTCIDVARAIAGGSYQVLNACADQEEAAAEALKN